MRKILISIICTLCVCSAFAAGENVATSKAFVDAGVAQKQDKISANTNPNNSPDQVLTNTGESGTVGTKDIYDSSAAYAGQTDSLIDAQTMNAGVQNAIDTEFECISYNANGDCLLVRLAGITELPSGYTELKYLQGTGEQYIDTGLYFDFSSSYNIFGKATNIDLQNRNVILGSYSDQVAYSSNSISFEFGGGGYSDYSGHFRVWASSMEESAWSANAIPTDVEVFYNMVYNPDSKVLDTNIKYNNDHQNLRVVVGRDGLTRSGLTMRSLRFFRDHRSYNSSEIKYPIKIGEHRIYKNNVAVGVFIPARRDSDGVLGMYDTVTNTFLTNSGDGEFIAGPAVNQYMPSGN